MQEEDRNYAEGRGFEDASTFHERLDEQSDPAISTEDAEDLGADAGAYETPELSDADDPSAFRETLDPEDYKAADDAATDSSDSPEEHHESA